MQKERENIMAKGSEENVGLSLLKKGQKGLVCAIFSRLGLFLILLALQLFGLVVMFQWLERDILPFLLGGTTLFTICMVLYLINSSIDSTAKITWLILIMLFPIFGTLLFWYTASDIGYRAMKGRLNQLLLQTKDSIPSKPGILDSLYKENAGVAALSRYICYSGYHTVYDNTAVTYFPSGEEKWKEMLLQLQQAKHFIFLEYFIVDEGLMWGKILEILAQKVKEDVEVRVMYDGLCEFSLLPRNYPKRLKELGIECKIFGRVAPFLSTCYNYRDHRKILVIDGHTAFNGGVNLADEYINHVEKFGHWKDTAVMLKGEAVKGFTLMFLQMWNMDVANPEIDRYLNVPVSVSERNAGYVIPYGNSPFNQNKIGEHVYMDILNRAKKYVHIMTPYLILDGEMETALKFAAERGVDVKIILPGIPDKTAPYALAKTHYKSLLESGVQIYEYTPGFVHAKLFVSDDEEAVIGTINLDYRSLYHHFECATYMYHVDCIGAIESDYQSTLKQCRAVTVKTVWEGKPALRLMGYALKAVAPLM